MLQLYQGSILRPAGPDAVGTLTIATIPCYNYLMFLTLVKIAIFCLVIILILKALKIVYVPISLIKWLILIGVAIFLLVMAQTYAGIF